VAALGVGFIMKFDCPATAPENCICRNENESALKYTNKDLKKSKEI